MSDRSSEGSEDRYSSEEETEIRLTTPKEKLEDILARAKQIVPWFKVIGGT